MKSPCFLVDFPMLQLIHVQTGHGAELSKTQSHIQVERMPKVPGSNPARGRNIKIKGDKVTMIRGNG